MWCDVGLLIVECMVGMMVFVVDCFVLCDVCCFVIVGVGVVGFVYLKYMVVLCDWDMICVYLFVLVGDVVLQVGFVVFDLCVCVVVSVEVCVCDVDVVMLCMLLGMFVFGDGMFMCFVFVMLISMNVVCVYEILFVWLLDMDVYCDYWYMMFVSVGEMQIVVVEYGWDVGWIVGDLFVFVVGSCVVLLCMCYVFFCLIGFGFEDIVIVYVLYMYLMCV